jgi:hypothetical protein
MFGELDRLPNDPDMPMQPALIWRLLDKASEQVSAGGTMLCRIMVSGNEPEGGISPEAASK